MLKSKLEKKHPSEECALLVQQRVYHWVKCGFGRCIKDDSHFGGSAIVFFAYSMQREVECLIGWLFQIGLRYRLCILNFKVLVYNSGEFLKLPLGIEWPFKRVKPPDSLWSGFSQLLGLRISWKRDNKLTCFRTGMVFPEVMYDCVFLWREIDVILGILFNLPKLTKYVVTWCNRSLVRHNNDVGGWMRVSPGFACEDLSKSSSNAVGVPGVLNHWLCNTSYISVRCLLPVTHQFYQVCQNQSQLETFWNVAPIRSIIHWLEWEVTNHMSYDDSCDGILGIGQVYKDETLRVETNLCEDLLDIPPIPETVNYCDWWGRPRDWMICLETNDIENPESSKAQTLIDMPSGAMIWAWQVMRRVFRA